MIKLQFIDLKKARMCDCYSLHEKIPRYWKTPYKGFLGRVSEGERYDQFTIGYKKYPCKGYEKLPKTLFVSLTIGSLMIKFQYQAN